MGRSSQVLEGRRFQVLATHDRCKIMEVSTEIARITLK